MSDEQRAEKTLTTKGEELIERLVEIILSQAIGGFDATLYPAASRARAETAAKAIHALYAALIGEREQRNPARIWDDERKVFVRPTLPVDVSGDREDK